MEVYTVAYSPRTSFSPSAFNQVYWPDFEREYTDSDLMEIDVTDSAQQAPAADSATEPGSQDNPLTLMSHIERSSLPIRVYSRARNLPEAEWERVRPIILQLYVDEERQLEDVRRILSMHHDFNATVQMYKKRFARWKVRKNYSRQQKDEIIVLQENSKMPSTHGNHGNLPIILNGKRLKQQKIERYRRQLQKNGPTERKAQVSCFHPQHSPESINAEMILLEIKYYSSWCYSQANPEARLIESNRAHELFQCIYSGRLSLTKDPRRAFALFNKACSNIPALLLEQRLHSVYTLLNLFGDLEWWDDYSAIKTALLDYVRAVAQRSLGPVHPVTKTLSLLVDDLSWSDLMLRLWRLLCDNAMHGANVMSLESPFYSQLIRVNSILIQVGLLETAEEELSRLVKQIQSTLPRTDVLLRQANYQLALVHRDQGDLFRAEQEWLEVVDLCVEVEGQENGSSLSISTCWRLGRLYNNIERNVEAERYLRLALEGAFEYRGADDPETLEYLEDLEEFLVGSGRIKEAEKVRQEYADVYASLDGYYLKAGDSRAGH